MTSLPTGRRGQVLAAGLTLLLLAVLWLGVAAPAIEWYADRADHLDQQRELLARMQGLVATAPALERQLAAAPTGAPAVRAVFDEPTDAVAGAALQQAVQDLATRQGATIRSAEILPAEAAGAYRRIALHVTATGTWPVLIGLFQSIADASPRMLVDDLSLHPSMTADAQALEAGFTVIAFHTVQPVSRP